MIQKINIIFCKKSMKITPPLTDLQEEMLRIFALNLPEEQMLQIQRLIAGWGVLQEYVG